MYGMKGGPGVELFSQNVPHGGKRGTTPAWFRRWFTEVNLFAGVDWSQLAPLGAVREDGGREAVSAWYTRKAARTQCSVRAASGTGCPMLHPRLVAPLGRATTTASCLCEILQAKLFLDRPQPFEGLGELLHVVEKDLAQIVFDLMEGPAEEFLHTGIPPAFHH